MKRKVLSCHSASVVTDPDSWYTIEGRIVGWLDTTDGSETMEKDVAVVDIDLYNGDPTESIRFALRLMINDYEIVKAADEYNVEIGDRIKFSTCRREQLEYAGL